MDRNELEKLLAKIDIEGCQIAGMSECCYDWTGSVDPKGRPRFFHNGKGGLARRALIKILIGEELPAGLSVMSICGNTRCMRPGHLHVANNKDARALGPNGSLSPNDIQHLRSLQCERGYDANDMAFVKNVSLPLAEKIFGTM